MVSAKKFVGFWEVSMNIKDTGNFFLPEQERPEIVVLLLEPVEPVAMLMWKVGFVDGIQSPGFMS